jgi:putative ABC transport system substrate-binding protein
VAVVLTAGYRAQCQEIVIIAGDSLESTARTISGAKHVIKRKNEQATFHRFCPPQPGESNQRTLDSIKSIRPTIVLTVGSAATKFAQDQLGDVPIVFSAVMYPAVSGFIESLTRPGRNITGASLDIPADIQFSKFKQIVPNLKRIGVMYTDNTASLIPTAMVVARNMELTLVPIKIGDVTEIPDALDSLAGSVEGIWSVADPNLFSPQSTKFILLNCLRKGIPFMGFSRYVVESGALFALDFDYKAIGRQTGEIANRIIAGEKAGDISVTHPNIIWFHCNTKTAEHLGISIPEELVAVAKEVYR